MRNRRSERSRNLQTNASSKAGSNLLKSLLITGSTLLAGCTPNLYSLPTFTSTNLHNEPALRFLKEGGPATAGDAGPGLLVKDPYADGRLVALTASGGGMRASAFTLGVLAELDEICGPSESCGSSQSASALNQVDLISSISGGSWAMASLLVARIHNRDAKLASALPQIERDYSKLANANVKHWANAFIPAITGGSTASGGLTFADAYPPSSAQPLPFIYFNATLYPSHSPFVFTPAYLQHYKVKSLGDPAVSQRIRLTAPDLIQIPIGYAAAASSAVPGYTTAFAETDICNQDPRPSFCFNDKQRRDNLQIVDGGLYDNIGYKTALEIGLTNRDRIKRGPATIIMIDSADVEDFQTLAAKDRTGSHIASIAMASSFPNQNATFDRLYEPAFAAAGFDARIRLDFSSAMGFDPERDGRLLSDLPELAYFAAHDVACWADDGSQLKGVRVLRRPVDLGSPAENLRKLTTKGHDCASMNFARTGYLYKTTFKYDDYRFRLNYQLGRLIVRMKRPEIAQAIFRTSRTDVQ